MSKNNHSQPLCNECKLFRKVSEKEFVCGKFNLEMSPLSRTELKHGCWEKKEWFKKTWVQIIFILGAVAAIIALFL